MDLRALSALAAGLLAVGSGCMTADGNKTASKKPDVTQPGVLPPPQETMKPAHAVAPSGGVIPAGGVQTGAPGGTGQPPPVINANNSGGSPLSKLIAKTERKVPASEMAVAWRNRIGYLPDPTRNGAMGAGIVGQMFLYGGPNLQFALADGTLTVDLVDETPRAPGQSPATPERWQFDKNTLRKLRTMDETFGKSYVLFLPWPAYRANITRVRISARYDPDNGDTIYATPSVVTIDTSGPLGTQVWDGASSTIKPAGGVGLPGAGPQPFSGVPAGPSPGLLPINPIPLGNGSRDGGNLPRSSPPPDGAIPLSPGTPAGAMPPGSGPIMSMPPAMSGPVPLMPLSPGAGMPVGAAPPGVMPAAPLPPIGITLPSPSR